MISILGIWADALQLLLFPFLCLLELKGALKVRGLERELAWERN